MGSITAGLGLDPGDATLRQLRAALATEAAPPDWLDLAAVLVRLSMPDRPVGVAAPWPAWDAVPPPLLLGVAGGQGSGKSTLARQLERAFAAAGGRAVACSLDDFYLSRDRRHALAQSVHPLLATRGVPGTHDVALLGRMIDALGGAGSVALPGFDKGADDRLPEARWRTVQAPLDVLVLEGWCVGAEPQDAAELAVPLNDLEATEDADGTWRRYVNDALAGAYADLWHRLHGLIFLAVPDLAAVRRWRARQERDLPASRRMSAGRLTRFVAHYERLTRAMLRTLPGRADLLVRLDADHRVVDVSRPQHSEFIQR